VSTKLTDTQRKVLAAAAAHENHAIAIPSNIRGGAAKKLAEGLIAAGLARNGSDGLIATAAGLRAAGAESKAKRTRAKPGTPRKARAARTGTKQEQIIALLRQPDGATLAEVCKATEWQPHTARAFISATLGKRLGLWIKSEKVEGRGRVYRIAG
jgi:hypothetical protein